MTQPSVPDLPPPFQLSRMITSLWVPRAIHAACAFGIPDLLVDGPRRSDDLAQAAGADPDSLARLLRALVVLGICSAGDDDRFALTPLGECLRTGTRDSVRAWALLMGGDLVWRAWGRLAECIRAGKSVPDLDGVDHFAEIGKDPGATGVFDEAMVQLTKHLAGAVAMAYDFSGIRRLVDVGGGHGALLPPILAANPDMRATVVDLPRCRDGALALFAKTRIADRCDFVAQDIFESVPGGGDAYVLKSVIHDWDDDRSLAILRRCRAAMRPDARLLLVEVVVPERPGTSPMDAMIAATDLNMLVNTGGKERTEGEYGTLLESAGFRVAHIVPTPAAMSVIDARPV